MNENRSNPCLGSESRFEDSTKFDAKYSKKQHAISSLYSQNLNLKFFYVKEMTDSIFLKITHPGEGGGGGIIATRRKNMLREALTKQAFVYIYFATIHANNQVHQH